MRVIVKNIIVIITILLVTGSITAYAVFYSSAKNITFSSDKTTKNNVEDSLIELYDMVGSGVGTPTHSNLTADGLIALNEMVEMDQPATTQLAATKDWRYTGANPNNYIMFNNEMWRIIGVFNVDDGTGTLEKRIKIIRNEPLQERIAFDTTPSFGVNDWTISILKTYLNGDYYNSLTVEAKSQIKESRWYLGGWNTYVKPSEYYNYERGETTYDNSRPTNWTGTIALMYMSDYGYAVGGSDRATCLNTNMSSWSNDSPSCRGNSWINKPGLIQRTVVPNSHNTYYMWNINDNGGLEYTSYYGISTVPGIRPSLYLKPDVTLTGAGTEVEPYKID